MPRTIFRTSLSAYAKTIPAAALRVARTIYTALAELPKFPYRGRIGLAPGTREIVFSPWPYIAVYEIIEEQLQVLRIRHLSQNWP